MKFLFSLLPLLLVVSSCSKAPESTTSSSTTIFESTTTTNTETRETDGANDLEKKLQRLWFLTAENGETSLGFYDPRSKEFSYHLLPLGSDTKLVADPKKQGLFILQRMHKDAIFWFNPQTSRIEHEYFLQEGVNPQWVYRDRQGRVWVSCYDSNRLLVLDEKLTEIVTEFDLSSLKDESDPWAELSYIGPLDQAEKIIGVLAQRIQRGPLGQWIPHAEGGLAVIDSEKLQLQQQMKIPLSNPLNFFAHQNGEVELIGSGDLTLNFQAGGKIMRYSAQGLFQQRRSPLQELSLSPEQLILESPTSAVQLLWRPKQQSTCLTHNQQTLFCAKDKAVGYVFSALTKVGTDFFLAYRHEGLTQLWKYSLTSGQLEKISLAAPLLSLAAGP